MIPKFDSGEFGSYRIVEEHFLFDCFMCVVESNCSCIHVKCQGVIISFYIVSAEKRNKKDETNDDVDDDDDDDVDVNVDVNVNVNVTPPSPDQ